MTRTSPTLLTTRTALTTLISLLSGAALTLATACIAVAPHPAPAPIDNRSPAAPPSQGRAVLPDGDYACTLTSGGYTYQPYRCLVSTANGVTSLEKLEGSQRVKGMVTFGADDGFRFQGGFFCEGGGCERPVDTVFARQGDATWGAPIGNEDTLQLVYVPTGMYGGAMYGGGDYGGYGYGGYGYGGQTYGAY